METETNQPKPRQRRVNVEYKGVPMTLNRALRIKELIPFIEKANEKGMTFPKAADWMGWSVGSLRNWVRILGITWKNKPNRTIQKHDTTGWEERIVKAFAEGKTQTQIASEMGIGLWNVSRYVKRRHLSRPNDRTK